MLKAIIAVAILVTALFCGPARAAGLPGLKGSIVGDFDYWSPPDSFGPDCMRERMVFVDLPVMSWDRFPSIWDKDLPEVWWTKAHYFSVAHQSYLAHLAVEKAAVSQVLAEPYILLADTALRERRYTEAELGYLKADELLKKIEKNPKLVEQLRKLVLSGLAGVAERRENWVVAEKYLKQLLELDPKNVMALQHAAHAVILQNDVKDGLAMLRAAYKVDPQKVLVPEVTMARTMARFLIDESQPDILMERAAVEHPDDLRTHLAATEHFLGRGQIPRARRYADKAIQIDPQSQDAELLRGIVAMFEKDNPTAEKYFESIIVRSPNNFAANNDLALVLCEQQNAEKCKRAVMLAQANLNLRVPPDTEAIVTYAYALDRSGEVEKARIVFDGLLPKTTVDFSLDEDYYVACILHDQKRDADALTLLDTVHRDRAPFRMRAEAEQLRAKLRAAAGLKSPE